MSIFGKKIIPLIAAAALLVGLTIAAHEGEEEEGTEEVAVDSTVNVDSVYALINEDYLSVKPIFQKSCFDCHSNQTDYPWYHKLPLVKSLIDDDIEEARKHLDFSDDFPFKSHHTMGDILGDIKTEIEEGDMPLLSYRMMHWGSKVEGEQKDSVIAWVERSLATLNSAGLVTEEEGAGEGMEEHDEDED